MDLPSQSLLVYMAPHTWVLWGVLDQLEQGELEKHVPIFLLPALLPLFTGLCSRLLCFLSGEAGGQNWELRVGFFPLCWVPLPGCVDMVSLGASVECDVLPLKMEAQNRHSEEMIHLTYFSPRLLQHWGCPAGIPMAWTWGQEFCPYCPWEATRAKERASGHGPVPTVWFSTLVPVLWAFHRALSISSGAAFHKEQG